MLAYHGVLFLYVSTHGTVRRHIKPPGQLMRPLKRKPSREIPGGGGPPVSGQFLVSVHSECRNPFIHRQVYQMGP